MIRSRFEKGVGGIRSVKAKYASTSRVAWDWTTSVTRCGRVFILVRKFGTSIWRDVKDLALLKRRVYDKIVVQPELPDRSGTKILEGKSNTHFRREDEFFPKVGIIICGARDVLHFEACSCLNEWDASFRLGLSPEELSGVHDTFHVSNLKKCLVDASLHVPLDDTKVDKTLRFVENPIEIMDREVKSLKRSRISLVKVIWNSKRGPEFTWEREDYMKSKYPHLFVERADESAS
ncbi:hypothetical protein Tco_0173515 [Tanacetum coccineum]